MEDAAFLPFGPQAFTDIRSVHILEILRKFDFKNFPRLNQDRVSLWTARRRNRQSGETTPLHSDDAPDVSQESRSEREAEDETKSSALSGRIAPSKAVGTAILKQESSPKKLWQSHSSLSGLEAEDERSDSAWKSESTEEEDDNEHPTVPNPRFKSEASVHGAASIDDPGRETPPPRKGDSPRPDGTTGIEAESPGSDTKTVLSAPPESGAAEPPTFTFVKRPTDDIDVIRESDADDEHDSDMDDYRDDQSDASDPEIELNDEGVGSKEDDQVDLREQMASVSLGKRSWSVVAGAKNDASDGTDGGKLKARKIETPTLKTESTEMSGYLAEDEAVEGTHVVSGNEVPSGEVEKVKRRIPSIVITPPSPDIPQSPLTLARRFFH